MSIVKVTIEPGTPLTPEQKQMLDALEGRPIVYDEDCPKLTPEQLAKFRRVNPALKAGEQRSV